MSPSTSDDKLIAEWTQEQHSQAKSAIFDDENLPFSVTHVPSNSRNTSESISTTVYSEDTASLGIPGLETVAGFDISFRSDSDGEEGIAVLAVLSFPDMKLIRAITRKISLKDTPYIHSYLSFRESDHYVSLLSEIGPEERMPQVLFVDGNGRWHSRQGGSAVAVGVKTGLPTVGVAKEYHPIHSSIPDIPLDDGPKPLPYPLDYLTSQKAMRKACQLLLEKRGDWIGLPGLREVAEGVDNEHWGAAVITSPARNASNPIFVSSGHRLSLETSIRLALACSTNGKVPEPVRQADLIGKSNLMFYSAAKLDPSSANVGAYQAN
ncbi:hypothetical protein JCM5353_004327 [Sporobolomyces roseus]